MKLSILTSLVLFALPALAEAQRMTIHIEQGSLDNAFQKIMEKSDVQLVYNTDVAAEIECPNISFEETEFSVILSALLANTNLEFKKADEVYIISCKILKQQEPQQEEFQKQQEQQEQQRQQEQEQLLRTVIGKVFDAATGEPLPYATVVVKGTNTIFPASENGVFTITVPSAESVLQFSFVGYETMEVSVVFGREMIIQMRTSTSALTNVIVTGIYSRDRTQHTGSAVTYSLEDLKIVGNQNVLSSLKTLDPSFLILESNDFGSDPNRMPDIEIGGKTSVLGLTSEYGTDPNQPLFILDGFETSLATIRDLSMDMVQSITILKDAAATAIYGSKAANGIVVVETRRPESGKLRINYNGGVNITWADLTDYNLMNAAEKVEFERMSLRFGWLDPNGYPRSDGDFANWNELYKEVLRGVDSYWLSEPIRLGVTHNHNFYIDGGENVQYSANLSYKNEQGVMKNSAREVVNGQIKLVYRTGPLSFNNSLVVSNTEANNPTVPFSSFAKANPYYRKYDENGDVIKFWPDSRFPDMANQRVGSPLWNMMQKNINQSNTFAFTNNFHILWAITKGLRLDGRFGISEKNGESILFRSPFLTEYNSTSSDLKGSYSEGHSSSYRTEGRLTLTFGKTFGQNHVINAVGGFDFGDSKQKSSAYTVRGFVDDMYVNPNFANGYVTGAKPSYSDSRSRSLNYFINAGYYFDNRYNMEITLRQSGSSVFGVEKRFATTYALGLSWNIHNEAFFNGSDIVKNLRLRASVGNPGNQNFSDYTSLTVYGYNLSNSNPFGPSMIVNSYGNDGLQWQTTLNWNYGFDATIQRLKLTFDYFDKNTDPLLVYIGLPASTGATTIPTNLGNQVTTGYTISLSYDIIDHLMSSGLKWSVNANTNHTVATYQNMGSALERFNLENQGTVNLIRYLDGGSPEDLYAVKSLGIDPASGREVFFTKDGRETFVHNYADEVKVGNSRPKFEGVVGTTLYWKGFTASFNLRYRIGGQTFTSALYNKVENIDSRGNENQDRRALFDRWQKEGDNAKFKGVALDFNVPMSSRFVMDNNVLSGESISLGYRTNAKWVKKIGASSFSMNMYMNDIFHISTILNERGIEYPFARSVSFSMGINF